MHLLKTFARKLRIPQNVTKWMYSFQINSEMNFWIVCIGVNAHDL